MWEFKFFWLSLCACLCDCVNVKRTRFSLYSYRLKWSSSEKEQKSIRNERHENAFSVPRGHLSTQNVKPLSAPHGLMSQISGFLYTAEILSPPVTEIAESKHNFLVKHKNPEKAKNFNLEMLRKLVQRLNNHWESISEH